MKRKLLNQVCCFSMAALTLLSGMPVYAAENVSETQNVQQDASSEVIINGVDSRFSVTVPKNIAGSGTSGTLTYGVTVEGDIAGNESVNVVPDENVTLSQKNKADIVANIAQDKTQWYADEFATIGNGVITYSDLSAGDYNGVFNFNIALEEGSDSDVQSVLMLSADDIAIGAGNTVQVNAYLDGEVANDLVTWDSDNENIIVTDGLVETSATAQPGDSATITVTAENPESAAAVSLFSVLDDTPSLYARSRAVDTLSASFSVTVVDMAYTVSGGNEVITSLDIKVGDSKTVEVTIIPASASGTVSWSTTAPAGLSLATNGNTVTLKVASDMPVGNTYDLVATYGSFSKLLKINIISNHEHSYIESVVNATCTEDGLKTFTCECGDTYTEVIPATGHNYVDGVCENCGEEKRLEAGLYDANGVMLCSWEESGIDAETDYSSESSDENYYKTITTSGYYVLTNVYPTATKVVIPDNISYIGTAVFYNCSNLISVVIPDSVHNTGTHVFFGCTNLADAYISSNITNIKKSMFCDCTSLTSINIPDGVTSIELYAFYRCSSLTSINIPDGVTSIGAYVFYGCSSLTSIDIPNSVTFMGMCAFQNCTSLVNAVLSDSMTFIALDVFCDCSSLTSIMIPDSVTEIGNGAFDGCSSLTSVMIPDSVISIGNLAFDGCSSLISITIPDSVTSIGNSAFYGCTGLTNVVIGSGVTNIGSTAFYECSNLSNAVFKVASGWYSGPFADTKYYVIDSSVLANPSTAAAYLKAAKGREYQYMSR